MSLFGLKVFGVRIFFLGLEKWSICYAEYLFQAVKT